MICPRWTPRATATLANLGGSSRQASSRRILFPCRGSESKRGFSTSRGRDEDGFADRLFCETPQSFNASQQSPSFGSTTGQAPSRARPATANSSSVDRRPRHKSKIDGHRPSWIGRGGGDAQSESRRAPRQDWPHLRRREREGRQGQEEDKRAGNAALAIPKVMFPPHRNVQNPKGTTDSSRVMLVLDGLSVNLNATDFYRITPTDLSDWQSVITKVQQQRNPDTFEPLGRYLVTFSNGVAAASYRDRLVRLHKLNSFKLRSASGLWESSVPSSLKVSLASPSGSGSGSAAAAAVTETSDAAISNVPSTESVIDLVNTFTLAPGSQAVLPVQRKKVALTRPWAKRLAGLVESLGYGERPSVLMVDIYPPTLTAEELHRFIRRDDQNRGLRWHVSVPQHLKTHSPEQGSAKAKAKVADDNGETKERERDEAAPNKQQHNPSFTLNDHETWEKLKGRFVLACADEAEARRFQQSWNHRALTTLRPRPARLQSEYSSTALPLAAT
ncbi:hypothetical protein TARUN_9994 [Trichoderma arundinaceum]|uniref:Uncharacterized protein n=1 Tax=Trichoderma arundinaceum TaxID=490622 RepID=A0A395N809_TRIAR|nr:hypothetical protein TARUN_9994 [Trichoderma arundinaceum]